VRPDTKKYTFVDTCYGTHHLQFAYDEPNDMLTSGGGQVVGWLDTKSSTPPATPQRHRAGRPVLDTNGNGRRDDGWVSRQPADAKRDARIAAGFWR
jgi:hypothetical protein